MNFLPRKEILSYEHVKHAVEEYMVRLSLINDDESILTLEPMADGNFNVYVGRGREEEVTLTDQKTS